MQYSGDMGNSNDGSSYVDKLFPGEELPQGVQRIVDELERQGWTCIGRIKNQLHYACPNTKGCKHSAVWISTVFAHSELEKDLVAKTCLRPFGE
jgi:hypothetical protein